MAFEDKRIEITSEISIEDLIDNIVEMDDSGVLGLIIAIDKRVSDNIFSMDLIISLINNMSGEFKNGDLIKIRSALTNANIKEGKQCSL